MIRASNTRLFATTFAPVALATILISCGGDDGPKDTSSPERRTVAAGATQEAINGRDLGITIEREGTSVPVRRLLNGTLVAGKTPLSPDEATRIAPPAPPASDAAGDGTSSPSPSNRTPIPVPTAPGNGRIEFSSYAPIKAAVGEEFKLTLVASGPDQPFQGYQWNIYTNDAIELLKEEPDPAPGFNTCNGFSEVALNQHYGGCIQLGDFFTKIYSGLLTVVTFRCASAGPGEIRLLNSLEGSGFPTSFLLNTGAEFGGPAPGKVEVTCV